jgi:hypothetical protein
VVGHGEGTIWGLLGGLVGSGSPLRAGSLLPGAGGVSVPTPRCARGGHHP